MRNLTLTIHFCDISQSFVSATKYENTSIYLIISTIKWCKSSQTVGHHFKFLSLRKPFMLGKNGIKVFDHIFPHPDILERPFPNTLYSDISKLTTSATTSLQIDAFSFTLKSKVKSL
jgi:hypothetical protein